MQAVSLLPMHSNPVWATAAQPTSSAGEAPSSGGLYSKAGTWSCLRLLPHRPLLCSYRMDYMKFVEHHRATGADITIGCLPVDHERAADFGLMKIDEEGNIIVSPSLHRLAHGPSVACSRLSSLSTLHNASWHDPGAPLDRAALSLGKRCQRARRCRSTWLCKYSLPADSSGVQDFAEKPKGDALKAMQVDTTVLGEPATRAAVLSLTVTCIILFFVPTSAAE